MNEQPSTGRVIVDIDFLPPDLTALAGGIGLMSAPGRGRALGVDLDELVEKHRCGVLVSLVGDRELEILGIGDLGERAAERGIRVIRFPFGDFSTPDSMEGVVSLTAEVLGIVRGGGTVVFHCWAGLGRTGMMAACCLVALGHAPDEAIAAVRRCRARTIETSDQEEFVVELAAALGARGRGVDVAEGVSRAVPGLAARVSADDPRAVAAVGAIHRGDVAGLRRLLGDHPELARGRIVDSKGVGRTLLHVVADWPGHFPNGALVVAALVASGADVGAVVEHARSEGAAETALHWAASSDDVGVLDALLDAGADIEAPGAVFTGGSAMSDAVVFAQWRAARRLLERGAKTTVWQAAALGLVDAVRQHVSAVPPPSREEVTNALWHACRGGQRAVAEILVAHGADPSWIGHDGKTPLDVARESGVAELVEWLQRRAGALEPAGGPPEGKP